jgi:hypothetical protein
VVLIQLNFAVSLGHIAFLRIGFPFYTENKKNAHLNNVPDNERLVIGIWRGEGAGRYRQFRCVVSF